MDLLASEYGWTKDYIYYQVYPDEYMELAELASQRSYKKHIMDINAALHPYREANDQRIYMEFVEAATGRKREPEPMDKQGLLRVKQMLSKR